MFRFGLCAFVTTFGLCGPVLAQQNIDTLKQVIAGNNFAVSSDVTLSAEPVIDLGPLDLTAQDLFIRHPIRLDDENQWYLFTVRQGSDASDPPVLSAMGINENEPVDFIVTFSASNSVYVNSQTALPFLLRGQEADFMQYALNCFALRFPFLQEPVAGETESQRWDFVPQADGGVEDCSTSFGLYGGKWLTFVSGDIQLPLLAMGNEAEILALLNTYPNVEAVDDEMGAIADLDAESGDEISPEQEELTLEQNCITETFGVCAEPETLPPTSFGGSPLYAGLAVNGLLGGRVERISLISQDSQVQTDLLELSIEDRRGADAGFWQEESGSDRFTIRLPGTAEWSAAALIPRDRFLECRYAKISASQDAYAQEVGLVDCSPKLLLVTLAVDFGFSLQEGPRLAKGVCEQDASNVEPDSPAQFYCASVGRDETAVRASDFGIAVEGELESARVEIQPGEYKNLATPASEVGARRTIVNISPMVRLRNQDIAIQLESNSALETLNLGDITVSSNNQNYHVAQTVVDPDDPSTLIVSLEFPFSIDLQSALNTTSLNATVQSNSDDFSLVFEEGTSVDRRAIALDLRGENTLGIALNSSRLPSLVALDARLVGYDRPVINYSCRIGLSIDGGPTEWLEISEKGVSLPAALTEREFDPDQNIHIVTGPSSDANLANCLPDETRIMTVAAQDFPTTISVPFARPVLVYWLRTGSADEFYNLEAIHSGNEIYQAWIDTVESTFNGQRIFAIRKPNSGGFETIQRPSLTTDPVNTSISVPSLVSNNENETFGDVQLRQVFDDAEDQAIKLGLGSLGNLDIVILSSISSRTGLGQDGGCGQFAQAALARPFGSNIVILRDLRAGSRPSSEGGPFTSFSCQEVNDAGLAYTVHMVETKAASPVDNQLVDYNAALAPKLEILVE